MESKGKLISAAKDWASGKFRLTFEIDDDVSGQIDGIADKPLRIKAAQWREKRSLDSNAYYWVLLSKLAEDLHISKPRAHNIMLREYGQVELVDGSSRYDTAEMSHLLDGLIYECKVLGIETATPEELERMKQLYDQNRREDG